MSTWQELRDNPILRQKYDARVAIIRLIREYFWSQNFVETDTPVALRAPGQEPYLNPVPVVLRDERGQAHDFYLQTSPEYSMKKLLAAGYEKIFQICQCWRDHEEFGGTHNPEFTMIEWYRAPGRYEEIMDDVEKMVKYVGERLMIDDLRLKDCKIDILGKWDRISMKELWRKYLNINLDDYLTVEKMGGLARSLGYSVDEKDVYEDVFYKIFLNKIELNLGLDRPVIVYEYPAQMAALARVCPHNHRYAERFEVYIGGLELANAFGELTDANEQERRFVAEQRQRAALGKTVFPIDKELINALKCIPSAAGIALGVDRLAMIFTEAGDINEVRFDSEKE
jgi:lysyl-tRNA synthetase class 2